MVFGPHLPFLSTQMLSIKDSASFSAFQNTTPLNMMLYCFPEFQLQFECVVLRGATWWISLIIRESEEPKRDSKGDRNGNSVLAEELRFL